MSDEKRLIGIDHQHSRGGGEIEEEELLTPLEVVRASAITDLYDEPRTGEVAPLPLG